MASGSGIVLHTGTYSQLRMDWSSTPNTAANQSSFTATLYVQVTTAGWNIGPWTDYNGSYFGTSTGNTFNGSIGNIATGRTNLRTFTTTVNHASDGKGSINIVWKWGVNSSWGGVVNPSGSRTLTLDTIARTSKHTLSHSSRNFGETLTITTNRASSSFTHKLWCQYAGRNVDIATGVTTSYAWAIPKDWANHLSDGVSTPMNVICDTYSGSTKIGSHTVQITINVSSSSEFQPRITGTSIVPGNDIGSPFSGLFVKGKSTLKATMSTAGAYSSWIKMNEIKANGQTFTTSSATTSGLSTAGTNTVSFKVIDSRNRTATASASVNVIDYTGPATSAVSAIRCNSDGSTNDQGTYAKVTVSAAVSAVSNKNTVSHQVWWRKAGTSDAYSKHTISISSYSLSNHSVVLSGFSQDSAYEIVSYTADYFGSATRTTELSTAFALMDFNNSGTGMAIGEVANGAGLNINMNTKIKKKLDIEGHQVHGKAWAKIASGVNNAPNPSIFHLFTITNHREGVHGISYMVGASRSYNYGNNESYSLLFNCTYRAAVVSNLGSRTNDAKHLADISMTYSGNTAYVYATTTDPNPVNNYNFTIEPYHTSEASNDITIQAHHNTRVTSRVGTEFIKWTNNHQNGSRACVASVVTGGDANNGYPGIAGSKILQNFSDDWIRTPKDGLLPYNTGGSSNLGYHTFPFGTLNVETINFCTTDKLSGYSSIKNQLNMGSRDIVFDASDSGDIVWRHNGTENARIWRPNSGTPSGILFRPTITSGVTCFLENNGKWTAYGYNTASSISLKTDPNQVNDKAINELFNNVEIKDFYYKDNIKNINSKMVGPIVEDILPDAHSELLINDSHTGLKLDNAIWLNWRKSQMQEKHINELYEMIFELKEELTELKGEVNKWI